MLDRLRSRVHLRADQILRLALGTSWIAGRVGTEARGAGARPRYGIFFERHQRLTRALALLALVWGAVYLTWRIGWTASGRTTSPVTFAMLLVTELYGAWALATLTWFSWKRAPATRPPIVSQPTVDVYVCTYDEPEEVVLATLAGCRALRYPHTTYLLDDGRRENMRALAELTGAHYLTRPDNSHAKAGNINAALPRTEGDLVFMLDADHVPMPDALDALVGYFEDPQVGLVQSPHDFSNQDSVQHYAVGRHEQSLFYHVICPGKDRHGAAFWCGSAAVIRREALLGIGGVATETIAEDFHTTIRLQRHGWSSRYHDEVLVQGLAPHDLDGYLLQRDRWSRGNLAVFTLPESPLRARELKPLQRLSYFASLAAYLAPPMRLLLLVTLALIVWTGWLPMRVDVLGLLTLWLPALALNLGAGSALARGYMRIAETTHYELMTMGIYTRALRSVVRPGRTAFKVTPKEGIDLGGAHALAQLKLACVLAVALTAGIVMRVLDLWGIGPLPDLPPVANVMIPLLAVVELRRILRTLALVAGRRQRRLIYRFEGDAPALCLTPAGSIPGRLRDANAAGLGLLVTTPLAAGARVPIRLQLEDSEGAPRDVHVVAEVRSCRASADGYVVGTRIVELEPQARVALMEWCYVVCSHQEVRGTRPGERPATSAPVPAARVAAQPRLVPQPAASIEPVPAVAV
ncbi:MAG TPA: glycosyltransferase [Conexibacter sp.]|nr:glycosyltransferase [Conexibacter sp.]